jgi:DNA polymerase-3 subunit gamma/tau
VDKVRDLIDKINFSPSSGKYKVYIIDELHMLSKGAFNALLKTLEEPPKHAVFVLATTEIHRIPATIISRCQRFDFRRLKVLEIKSRLREILKKEKVRVEDSVLDFIAVNSSGGLRDSESLLGQILSLKDNDITLKEVQEILAVTDVSVAVKMIKLILDEKYSEAVNYVNEITDDGYDLEQFAGSVIEYTRKLMLIKISPEMKKSFSSEMTEDQIAELESISQKASISQLVKIIRVFVQAKEEIKSSIIPQLPLELAITEINIASKDSLTSEAGSGYNGKMKEPIKKIADKVSQSVKQSQNFIKKSMGLEKKTENKKKDCKQGVAQSGLEGNCSRKNVEAAGEENISLDLDMVRSEWCDILEDVKPHNHSLTAFLKTCQPVDVNKNEILISCKYSFHKDKLQMVLNRSIIEEVASEALKTRVTVKFITHDEAERLGYKIEDINFTKKESKKGKDDLVDSALDMFGGKVV